MRKKPIALIIMDGYALSEEQYGNAIEMSGSCNIKKYMKDYPSTKIGASGMDVGLPDGQMGNSEVGHLNLGAGRIVYQELTRISKAIVDGDFFTNEELVSCINSAKINNKKLHIYGLLSDGGVHSHNTHLYAVLELAKKMGLENAYAHCFLDGRDVSPTSGSTFIFELQQKMDELNFGTIASVAGRYYAMDRDNRWDRVEKAYDTLTIGSENKVNDAVDYVDNSYKNGVTDEFMAPANIIKDSKITLIEKGDSVIFFNFRPDRARELTRAFTEKDFAGFERKTGYLELNYTCFTRYDDTFTNVSVAFKPQSLKNTLGEYLSSLDYNQLRIAETEKYAHVTFFFNGGEEVPNRNEDRELIASPKVATYDLKPEMSAEEITERLLKKLDEDKYDVIILNFANCDMVGHTGVMESAIKAVQTVDTCVKKVVDKIVSLGGEALITADHGNADKMYADDGSKFTAHTTNPVPLILVTSRNLKLSDGGVLADVAPTLLDLMNVKIPQEMTGKSLLIK